MLDLLRQAKAIAQKIEPRLLRAHSAAKLGIETRYRVHSNATEILKRIKTVR